MKRIIEKSKSLKNLATSLVNLLGVADAIRTCQDNSWYGVLNYIRAHNQNGTLV